MSDPNIFNPALVGPQAYAQQLQLQRQQQLADLLTQQGVTPISPDRHAGGVNGGAGYVVPISPLEGLSHIGSALAGAYMQKQLNQKQANLLSQEYGTISQRLGAALGGSPNGSQGAPMSPVSGSQAAPVPPVNGSAPQVAPMSVGNQGTPVQPDVRQLMALKLAGVPVPDSVFAAGLPTTDQRNATWAAGSDAGGRAAALAKMLKDGTIMARPNETVRTPGQAQWTAPDPASGIGTYFDQNGVPHEYALPGAITTKAAIAGAIEGAKTGSAYVPMGTSQSGATIYGQPAGGVRAAVPSAAQPSPSSANGVPGAVRLPQTSPFLSPQEKALQETSGKDFANYENSLNERVRTGQSLVNRDNEILNLMTQFRTGSAGADVRVDLARVAKSINLPDSVVTGIANGDLAAGEQLQKHFVQGALDSLKQALQNSSGSQSQIRVAEFKAFQEANPHLEMQPDAIKKILDFSQQIYGRDFAEQQALMQARQAGTFNPTTWQAQYAQVRDQQLKAERQKAPTPQYREGMTATNPQTGQRLIFKGGQWVQQ